jgi:hypothetical protein
MLAKFAEWQDCTLNHVARRKPRALMVNGKTQHYETPAVKLMFRKAIWLLSERTDRLPGDPPYQVEPSERCKHGCKHKYELPELSRHCHDRSLLA